MTLETTRRCYRVARCQISYIKFILEAYDNVAVMSTLDPWQAVVQITIAPGCETLVEDIMNSLAEVFEVDAGDDVWSTDHVHHTKQSVVGTP